MRNVQIRASRTPAVAATEYRASGSNERMVGRDGNLNASSTADLWKQQAKFLQAAASGEVIANDLYNDIVGNQDFGTFIDPVARHELLLTGELGVMYGMTLTSDAFRHPAHRVLSQGEFFVFSDAVNLGAYSDRGGLTSTPTDINNAKIPGRGWTVFESMAIAIVNPRGVAKGLRV